MNFLEDSEIRVYMEVVLEGDTLTICYRSRRGRTEEAAARLIKGKRGSRLWGNLKGTMKGELCFRVGLTKAMLLTFLILPPSTMFRGRCGRL